jgi:TRAP transporter TAXI family solute receptor
MSFHALVSIAVISACGVAAAFTVTHYRHPAGAKVSAPSLESASQTLAPAQGTETKQLSIATGGTGGVYYPIGGGLANLLGKHVPGLSVTAQVTGGSVANLQLVSVGKADIAFSQVDAAWDAFKGQDKFPKPIEARALSVIYPNHMQVVTLGDTGIKRIEDLKGKRVSTGSPGSAGEVFAFRLLEAAGIDPQQDIKRERLGVAEASNALKDRKLDAFLWVGGTPTAAVTDLAASPSMQIKLLDIAPLAEKMNAKYGPLYAESRIPKSTYKGMVADNENITVWNILAVHQTMSEDLAYQITKTVFEHRSELAQVHAEAGNIREENQSTKKAGVPFHPGALKYFQEKGLTVE